MRARGLPDRGTAPTAHIAPVAGAVNSADAVLFVMVSPGRMRGCYSGFSCSRDRVYGE